MSCSSKASKFGRLAAKVSGGIGQLSSQRAFYAGLALAGGGVVAAGLVTAACRLSRPVVGHAPLRSQDLPQLAPLATVQPTTPASGNTCATCSAAPQNKPGPWYRLGEQLYCRDCARQAADSAGVDLALPESKLNSAVTERPPVSRGLTPASQPLSPERRVATKLLDSRVRVRLGDSRDGPIWRVVDNATVVVDKRGFDTGLAITPLLKQTSDGTVTEALDRWRLTHIASGKALGGIYGSREEAQAVASILAQLDWTRSEADIPAGEMQRALATLQLYRQAVAETVARPLGERAGLFSGSPPKRSLAEPLTGRLIADGYGGLARVIDDQGPTLLACDHLGQRYEVDRRQARWPDEQDYELCRVAMPFDPARQPEAHCASCRRSTRHSGAGEPWFKMGWQTFCEGCAQRYAAQEAYIMEDEVGEPAVR